MNEHTCPKGTSWCTAHQTRTNEFGDTDESCVEWLYVQRAPLDHSDAKLIVGLYLSGSGSEDYPFRPAMGMSVFGSIPWGVQPESARTLAAALLRGADLVEASRTGTCVECGSAVTPDELVEDGTCYDCQRRRRVALHAMMRGKGGLS